MLREGASSHESPVLFTRGYFQANLFTLFIQLVVSIGSLRSLKGLKITRRMCILETLALQALSVSKSYVDQFQNDFSLFLKMRSEEVVSNGRMVLIFKGRNASDPLNRESCHYWSLLTDSLLDLVSEVITKSIFNLSLYLIY